MAGVRGDTRIWAEARRRRVREETLTSAPSESRMKICVLATGDSIHSFRWIDFFSRRGHEIHWVSLSRFQEPPAFSVRTYEVAPRRSEVQQIVTAVRELRMLLRRIQPDVLHMHSAGRHGLTGALSGFYPRIVTAWGSEVLIAAKSPLRRPFVKFVLRSANLVTCDAEHMRRAIMRMGVNEEKIRIIYFGTDTSHFRPRPPSAELRRELKAFGGPVIISLRSLEPIYDVESLVKAIPDVLRNFPKAVFVIAGTGSEREKVARLAEFLDVSDNLRFVGTIPGHQLPLYLNAADLYVSTSLSDAGLAASTAEAMACGLPVVVTDSGENRLWVKDGEGGFVVPLKDPTALAEKMRYLLEYPLEARRLGSFNRSVIEERNNYWVEMMKMEKLYEAIVERHGKS